MDKTVLMAANMSWDLEARRVTIACKVKTGLDLNTVERIADYETSWMRRNAAIDDHLFDEWQSRWHVSEKGRTTYECIPDVRFVSGVAQLSFTMRACFLLTGHGCLSGFLMRRNLIPNSSCICGEPVETAVHVLCTCPFYADIRNLETLKITLHDDDYDARYTQESRNSREEFAQEAFRRRYQLTHW